MVQEASIVVDSVIKSIPLGTAEIGIIAAIATITAPLLVWLLDRKKHSMSMMDSLISSIETLENIKNRLEPSLYNRLSRKYISLLNSMCPDEPLMTTLPEYKMATISWGKAYQEHGVKYLLKKLFFLYKPFSIWISIAHFYGFLLSLLALMAIIMGPIFAIIYWDLSPLLSILLSIPYLAFSLLIDKFIRWNAKKRASAIQA